MHIVHFLLAGRVPCTGARAVGIHWSSSLAMVMDSLAQEAEGDAVQDPVNASVSNHVLKTD